VIGDRWSVVGDRWSVIGGPVGRFAGSPVCAS
jgi:hypothetical protein